MLNVKCHWKSIVPFAHVQPSVVNCTHSTKLEKKRLPMIQLSSIDFSSIEMFWMSHVGLKQQREGFSISCSWTSWICQSYSTCNKFSNKISKLSSCYITFLLFYFLLFQFSIYRHRLTSSYYFCAITQSWLLLIIKREININNGNVITQWKWITMLRILILLPVMTHGVSLFDRDREWQATRVILVHKELPLSSPYKCWFCTRFFS